MKKQENVDLYLNMEATTLLTDENGAVIGVTAVDGNGKAVDFFGKKIILATGGYCANPDIYNQYLEGMENAVLGVNAPTTGDGLLMAEALGAATVNLDEVQLFPHVLVGYGLVTPADEAMPGGNDVDCIFVNQDAQRYVTEGNYRTVDRNAVLAQQKSFCIYDDSGLNPWVQARIDAGYVQSADSIRELAEKLSLDPDALEATIAAYNDDIADGVDDAFGKSPVQPLDGQKFYGYQFGVATHYCMGGIVINADTQVLREDGSIIENLYAAGEVTGGLSGTTRIDGNGDGDAFIFGRIAGEKTAEAIAE